MGSTPAQSGKTFISYAREDAGFASKLAADLRKEGVNIWLDNQILVGDPWPGAVEKALDSSSQFLVILSPDSVESKHVMAELDVAWEDGKRIFPVLHKECKRPLHIRSAQYADFTKDYQTGLSALLKALTTNGRDGKPARWRLLLLYAVVAGTLGGSYLVFALKPRVSISMPVDGAKNVQVSVADTGSGEIIVSGQSTNLKRDWQIYLAVKPEGSAGYYLQLCCPEAVKRDGSWEANGWYGGKQYPPKVGDVIQIVAVARKVALATEHQEPWMEQHPDQFNPKAKSSTVRITVGAIISSASRQ